VWGGTRGATTVNRWLRTLSTLRSSVSPAGPKLARSSPSVQYESAYGRPGRHGVAPGRKYLVTVLFFSGRYSCSPAGVWELRAILKSMFLINFCLFRPRRYFRRFGPFHALAPVFALDVVSIEPITMVDVGVGLPRWEGIVWLRWR
jgi:hypothetical protein